MIEPVIKADRSLLLDIYDVAHWVAFNGRISVNDFCNHFVTDISREDAKAKWTRCITYLRNDLGVEVRRLRDFSYKFDALPVKNRVSDMLDELALTEDPDAPEAA
jgi:hypothetical protein